MADGDPQQSRVAAGFCLGLFGEFKLANLTVRVIPVSRKKSRAILALSLGRPLHQGSMMAALSLPIVAARDAIDLLCATSRRCLICIGHRDFEGSADAKPPIEGLANVWNSRRKSDILVPTARRNLCNRQHIGCIDE